MKAKKPDAGALDRYKMAIKDFRDAKERMYAAHELLSDEQKEFLVDPYSIVHQAQFIKATIGRLVRPRRRKAKRAA